MNCKGLMVGPSFKLLAVKPGPTFCTFTKYVVKLLLSNVYGKVKVSVPYTILVGCDWPLVFL